MNIFILTEHDDLLKWIRECRAKLIDEPKIWLQFLFSHLNSGSGWRSTSGEASGWCWVSGCCWNSGCWTSDWSTAGAGGWAGGWASGGDSTIFTGESFTIFTGNCFTILRFFWWAAWHLFPCILSDICHRKLTLQVSQVYGSRPENKFAELFARKH